MHACDIIHKPTGLKLNTDVGGHANNIIVAQLTQTIVTQEHEHIITIYKIAPYNNL